MDAPAAHSPADHRPFTRGVLGGLDAEVTESLVAAAADVALLIDQDGIIRDISLSNNALADDGAEAWLDRPWIETVAMDSRIKVDQLLRDAQRGHRPQWREVNQMTSTRASLMVRFVAVDARQGGHVIALGRDGRETMALQQRLVQAQQAVERDYARLRDAEFRYRLLFRMSAEAVVVVDAQSRRVVEANPAAERMIGGGSSLTGEPFVRLFAPESQDEAAAMVAVTQSSARSAPADARLRCGDNAFFVSASLFRQDRTSYLLVRFAPAEAGPAAAPDNHLEAVLERVPDPFVITDDHLRIVAANMAFLDLVRLVTPEQARGQPLSNFIGRPGLERNILLDALQTHGSVKNFAATVRSVYEETEEAEISGVAAPDGDRVIYGITLRPVSRRLDTQPANADLRRSVEQLTGLVGRVTLKELVRETTDLVEKLCIEAALEITRNNRASAAEILGLSRQSLYSKLHRFGLTGEASEDA